MFLITPFLILGADEAFEVDDLVVAESKSLEVMEESMVVGDVIMEKSNSPDNVGYLRRQFLTAVYMNQVSYCGPFLA